ncbi:MAG: two-component system response regulator [Arcobacter sp.]|nr:MAG: two-component system response regulator [Arcobacter sp.]
MDTKDFTTPLYVIAVDDEPFNLELLKALSLKIYPDILTFDDPKEALVHIKKHPVDIMLVDYMMPYMNGIVLMKEAHLINSNILTIMITAAGDNEEIKLLALNEGAIDFLKKPLNAAEYRARMKNVSKLKRSQLILDDFNHQLEKEVARATQALIQREKEALKVLSNTAEYKDPETASHVSRVAHYSRLLAKAYGLDRHEQEVVFNASPLHDIGKVGISDAILLKPGKLDEDEMKEMKEHAHIGMKILETSENPFLKAGAIIAHTHHEKYDGSGYPRGLKAEEIHIYGRITALADVFDALTSVRPYKKAWSFEEAMDYLQEQRGKHFDPYLCNLFIKNIDEIRIIHKQFKSL